MLQINFQLEKDIDLSYLKKLLPKGLFGDSVKIQRFISERLAIEKYYKISVDVDLSKDKENKLFKEVYEKMENEEKSLFNIWQLTLLNVNPDQLNFYKDIEQILIKNLPGVIFVSPERTYKLAQTPDDPLYVNHSLPALDIIHCENAWKTSKGDSIRVAVIDSGINYTHPDIANNILGGPVPTQMIYRTFLNGQILTALNDVQDRDGHGTHMAGIIAAEGDNGTGTIGVAPKAKIIPIKAFDKYGNAQTRDLAQAIYFADSNDAHIINNSWFEPTINPNDPGDSALLTAIRVTINKEVIFVFAAGNGGTSVTKHWLLNESNIIIVGGTTTVTPPIDARLGVSNWSSKITISAPGEGILSSGLNPQLYPPRDGTSPATAHVSGALALYLARHGGHQRVHPSVVISVLRNRKYSDFTGVVEVGKYRINCEKLVQAP